MRKNRISYRRITLYIIFLILMSVATCLCVTYKKFALLLVCIPLLILSIVKLVSVYNGIINRLSFIIKAVKNDDYSFRFTAEVAYKAFVESAEEGESVPSKEEFIQAIYKTKENI